MTRAEYEEFKNQKFYFNAQDIAKIFECGIDKAYGIIRSIKSFSDTLRLAGKITVPEFEVWYNHVYDLTNQYHLKS